MLFWVSYIACLVLSPIAVGLVESGEYIGAAFALIAAAFAYRSAALDPYRHLTEAPTP